MKKLVLTALAVIMLTPLRANAFDWGSFFRWFFFGANNVQTVTTDEIKSTLTSVQAQEKTLDESVQKSFLAIIPLLTTQKDQTKYEKEIQKINSSSETDAKKNSQILDLISEYTTTVKNNKVGVLLIMKTSSDTDKTTLKNNMTTLSNAAQSYTELYKKGYDLTAKTSTTEDSEQTTAVANLNSASDSLKNKATVVYSFVNQVKTLATLSGIKL